jgi:hypothetical protein
MMAQDLGCLLWPFSIEYRGEQMLMHMHLFTQQIKVFPPLSLFHANHELIPLSQRGQDTQKHLCPRCHTDLRIMKTGGHKSHSISMHPLGRKYMGNGSLMSPPNDDPVSCNKGHSVSLSTNFPAV